jgi:hypothetical protein
MREITVFLALVFFIFFPVQALTGENVIQNDDTIHGLALCADTESFLISNGFEPKKKDLIKSGINQFPYNIEVTVPAELPKRSELQTVRQTLILAFTMEDALRFRPFVILLLDSLRKTQREYAVVLLFSYGDVHSETDSNALYGTNIYAANIDSPDDSTAVCVSFTQENAALLTPGGAGDTSPSWLVKRLSDAFLSSGIQYHLRGGSLGSLYRLGILKADKRSSFFLKQGIPSAGITIPEQTDTKTFGIFINKFLSSYTVSGTGSWDRHYFVFHAGSSLWWASERIIVICFIIISFVSLFILSELSFVRNKRKTEIKRDVFRLWYIFPVTVLISAVGFQISQPVTKLLYDIINISILRQFVLKIAITFIIITVLYLLIFKLQGVLEERAYAYILTVDSVINIFVFSAVDISLFFLFTAEYIVVYIFRPFKGTNMLVTAFIAMMIPFVPYLMQIIRYADPAVFSSVVYSTFKGNILLAAGMLPFLFQWLRIIARFNERWNFYDASAANRQILSVISFIAATLVIIIAFFTIVSRIPAYFKAGNAGREETNVRITQTDDTLLSGTVSDRTFFGDTTRTISVRLGREAESCTVTITGTDGNSVIYSDNEYTSDVLNRTDTFLIPDWPPETLTLSYVADVSVPALVTVKAVYPESGDSGTLRIYKIRIPPRSKKSVEKT